MARAFTIDFPYNGRTYEAWVNESFKPGLHKLVVSLKESDFNLDKLVFYSHDGPDGLTCADDGVDPKLVTTIQNTLKTKMQ